MPPLHCANASTTSAAKLFLQLCARRSSVAPISPTSSILDVLLPPRTRTFHLPPAARSPSRPAAATTVVAIPSGTGYFKQGVAPPPPPRRRGFASTGAWRKTQVVYNPQRDEDGNVMLLEITPRAANRLSQIMAKDGNPHLALRIQVESGGCHGFQYLMSLTTLPPDPSASASASSPSPATTTATEAVTPSTTTSSEPAAARLSEEDTVFAFVPDSNPSSAPEQQQQQQQQEQKQPDAPPATTSTAGMPKVVLDGPSLELLKGSKVDFTMELIGSQFKIVDNPLATSSCGCGTSFDIKF
ncbi:hypothetical protein F4809DRAFT_295522 [Biscogniauxia mediterranea]|nr:hypothetical protein F4809DRAFT_295522 [Biscogniauxia mediterranea]